MLEVWIPSWVERDLSLIDFALFVYRKQPQEIQY